MNAQPIVEFGAGTKDVLATVTMENIAEDNAIRAFQRALGDYVVTHPGTTLHLDLSHVHLFSCAVLTDLIGIQKELNQRKGALRLRGVHGNVRDIMKLTGMDKEFTLEHRHAR